MFCFRGNAEEMQRMCSVPGPCPRHCVQSLAHSSPSRGVGGSPEWGDRVEEPNGPGARPQHSPARLSGGSGCAGPQPPPTGAPSPRWGRQELPHPWIAGKPRAMKDGEGAGSPVLLRRAGTPPNLSRSSPDLGASAVRGERGWAPGPQQLENSLRETIKVDYPVGSWSGNYLVN